MYIRTQRALAIGVSEKSVIWDSDFDFEDYGYDGEGIVHVCHCANCGADIEYRIRTDNQD